MIKTDGLAVRKGVLVTESLAEARDAVRDYLSGRAFGDAGRTVVIEEGLTGPELSLLVLCDGSTEGVPLAPAQDYKRIGDSDTGPNTGGMGAYSPVPVADAALVELLMDTAVTPTLTTLARQGIEYRGVLYAGLMLTPEGPKVIEYNVRFGDPECQAVVPRLASDLAVHCLEAATGRLRAPVEFRDDACVTVVLATEGYPAAPRVGDVIKGLDDVRGLDDVVVWCRHTAKGIPLATAINLRAKRQAVTHNKRAGAQRPTQFVGGNGHHIDAQQAEVDADLAQGLHRIGVDQSAVITGKCHDFANGLDDPSLVVGQHHADEGLWPLQQCFQCFEADNAISIHRDEFNRETGGSCRLQHGRVLDGGDDDALGLHALDREVVRFRAAR